MSAFARLADVQSQSHTSEKCQQETHALQQLPACFEQETQKAPGPSARGWEILRDHLQKKRVSVSFRFLALDQPGRRPAFSQFYRDRRQQAYLRRRGVAPLTLGASTGSNLPLPRLGASALARVWNTPVFVVATVYFIVDGVFSHVTQPVTVWIAKKKIFERARLWIVSLRPYPSLALFAVPVIILEPAKPLAGYLLGTGHFFAGAVTFITAEVLKLTLVEQLFQINREKLLSIPAFAWGYKYWRRMMDAVQSMEVWKASRRLAANAAYLVRIRWLQFKHSERSHPFRFARSEPHLHSRHAVRHHN